MSKGNSGLLSKFQVKLRHTSSGALGDSNGYEILKEVVVRVRVANVFSTHTIEVQGRLETDNQWYEIGIVKGHLPKSFHVADWDRVRFVCRSFESNLDAVDVFASGFFNDGKFTADAVNNMNDNLSSILTSINSNLCDIKKELKINNLQLEQITNMECEDLI